MDIKERADAVYQLLKDEYPDTHTFLNYSNPYELMVAVILSAQTTDAQVNRISPLLFKRYPDPKSLKSSGIGDVENIIRSTGFYRVKARNITGAAKKLVTDFNSEVPVGMDKLLTLPGVGRKSANVIRAHCFDKPAIIVDTHFARVTGRIGLTDSKDPDTVEKDLRLITDSAIQTDFSMIINIHGRKVCSARVPGCQDCILKDLCRYKATLSE
ncbi:MAG: endonuclease III [Spirochaetales bacterium]|nr:endonuclease III [Spirochaetales bacterium]